VTTSSPVRPTADAGRRSAAARAAATALEAARPLPHGPARRLGRFVADVWRKSDRDRLLGIAAENAFMAVLTLFPILLVVAAVLGQLGSIVGQANADRVEQTVLDALDRLFTNSAGGAIDTARQLFETGGNTLTLASALALGSLATAFASIINTVTLAYDVVDSRGWWRRRWQGLLVGGGSVVVGALVVTLVVIGPLFGRAEQVVASVGLGQAYADVWAWTRWPVAFVSLVLWATTLNHICPDRVARWREGLPGGLLTAVLWLLASLGFNLYLKLALPASPVLGALGGGLILMTWLYLLCVGLLIGAEVNAVRLAHRQALGRRKPYDRRTRRQRRRDAAAPSGTRVAGARRDPAPPQD
jgi:membrane protein